MKKRVGLLFGGKSAEHEVSLQSAKNVFEAIDKDKYDVVLIGIDKAGKWHLLDSSDFLLNAEDPKNISLKTTGEEVAFIPGDPVHQLVKRKGMEPIEKLDCIFPILHGTLGEDGSIQGLFRVADIPFVGPDVLGSAISMDKDVAKHLLQDAGLDVARAFTFTRTTKDEIDIAEIESELGLPLFIKPANQGSSVGVSKVESKEEFTKAVEEAFKYDHKILIEEAIQGREIECSVLGNEHPKASIPGEIIATNDFYSYEAKYIDEHGATLEIPAKLNEAQVEKIQDVAIRAFKALQCEGMARVDVFLTENDRVIVNEINTIPGFTKISMYPKLWEESGISYSDLIDRLIQLAIERHERDASLESSFELE